MPEVGEVPITRDSVGAFFDSLGYKSKDPVVRARVAKLLNDPKCKQQFQSIVAEKNKDEAHQTSRQVLETQLKLVVRLRFTIEGDPVPAGRMKAKLHRCSKSCRPVPVKSPGILDKIASFFSPTATVVGKASPKIVKAPPTQMLNFQDVPRLSRGVAAEGVIPRLPVASAGLIPTFSDIWANLKTIVSSVDLWDVFWGGLVGLLAGMLEGIMKDFVLPSIPDKNKRALVEQIYDWVMIALSVAGIAALVVSLVTGGPAVLATLACSFVASMAAKFVGRKIIRGVKLLWLKLKGKEAEKDFLNGQEGGEKEEEEEEFINVGVDPQNAGDAAQDAHANGKYGPAPHEGVDCRECGPGFMEVGMCLNCYEHPANVMVLAKDLQGNYVCGHVSYCSGCWREGARGNCELCRLEIVRDWEIPAVAQRDCIQCIYTGPCAMGTCRKTINSARFPFAFAGDADLLFCSHCAPDPGASHFNMNIRAGGHILENN